MDIEPTTRDKPSWLLSSSALQLWDTRTFTRLHSKATILRDFIWPVTNTVAITYLLWLVKNAHNSYGIDLSKAGFVNELSLEYTTFSKGEIQVRM